jgi:AraC family transcriptional regulator
MTMQTSNAALGNEAAGFAAGGREVSSRCEEAGGGLREPLGSIANPRIFRDVAAAQCASSLPEWRLRRALDFIEANLAQPIGLADVAASTGLTRMHFAAQFRLTTGYSPHAYLLRRRIEHAQMLLRSSALNVLDIALSCGFGSHAHFTTVFGRMVGEPPNSWRTRMRGERPAARRGNTAA